MLARQPAGRPVCFWYAGHESHRWCEKGSGLKAGRKPEEVVVLPFLPDTPEVRSDILDYCVEVEWFDTLLARMLQALEDAGEADNTLIVVTGDNGMPFPCSLLAGRGLVPGRLSHSAPPPRNGLAEEVCIGQDSDADKEKTLMRSTSLPRSILRRYPLLAVAGLPAVPVGLSVILACLVGALRVGAADAPPAPLPGGFNFDGRISRLVLENYLARSICMEGMLHGRGDLADNIRMLKGTGAKYIGRALCLWNAENDFTNNVQRARAAIPQVLAADPEIILEACVFETVNPRVSQIEIPDWVFTGMDQPVEKRNFRYADMIYPEGQRRPMGRNAQVPDESKIETRLWFYYQARTYIDAGCEAIHFGQVEIMNNNDRGNALWQDLFQRVRAYAAQHARRHMVLLNGHTPTGGLMHAGNPLLDFNAFPLRVMETRDKPQEAILKLGFSDGLYNRSKGGRTPSGWTCDHLPYFAELDNYGVSRHPGEPNVTGEFNWVWGYDEITWFALQSRPYRSNWLQYAWEWVRKTDTNGFLQMPGSRTASSKELHWYHANNPSPALTNGLGDEAAIRAVWARAAKEASAK